MSVLDQFHPITRAWFERRFKGPTDAQTNGWPHIIACRDTLISGPTGSGKSTTLRAMLQEVGEQAIGRPQRIERSRSGALKALRTSGGSGGATR